MWVRAVPGETVAVRLAAAALAARTPPGCGGSPGDGAQVASDVTKPAAPAVLRPEQDGAFGDAETLNGDSRGCPPEIVYSGSAFFTHSLYMVPAVQYRDGIEYLGRTVSAPGLRQPRTIRFTVCLPVRSREHVRVSAGTTDGR